MGLHFTKFAECCQQSSQRVKLNLCARQMAKSGSVQDLVWYQIKRSGSLTHEVTRASVTLRECYRLGCCGVTFARTDK